MEEGPNVRFSIITVCFNAEKVIHSTIESVLNQKWSNFEYIIVDGASTDATTDIVQEFAKKDSRIQWSSKKDSGIYNAMNKGIHYAGGDFLLFLNAGDEFHSMDVLQKAAEVAEGADIIIGDVAFKVEEGLSEHKYAIGSELLENLKKGNNVCHQVIFATKECLQDGFDEHYIHCADYDWLCGQVKSKKKIAKLNAIVADFDIRGVTQQVRYQKIHWKEYFEVIEKHFPREEVPYKKEIKELFIKERKEYFLYKFMNRWLSLKQNGIELRNFFIHKGIKTIAIYGMHYMGQRLYDELRDSDIEVKYAIDRNPAIMNGVVRIVRPEDFLNEVDAIVITPIFDFLEIQDMLSAKIDCPMFSIEDILYYDYK